MTARTTLEVADAVGVDPYWADRILHEEEQRGHVERVGGGWALTASAEREFGVALRSMSPLIPERRRG